MNKFTSKDFENVYKTAKAAHIGQKRRSGEDYFSHPSSVRNIIRKFYPDDYAAQLVGLLHDTFEDAPGNTVDTVEEMQELVMNSIEDKQNAVEIVDAVKALTHSKSVSYSDYVSGIINDQLVLRVKLADMLHNLSSSPGEKQKAKYANAIKVIEKISDGIPEGISKNHWNALKALTESKASRKLLLLLKEVVSNILKDEK
jgi:guanosine-3',5'-bis(diphosphate) 3'-pyrophosphohydrolase